MKMKKILTRLTMFAIAFVFSMQLSVSIFALPQLNSEKSLKASPSVLSVPVQVSSEQINQVQFNSENQQVFVGSVEMLQKATNEIEQNFLKTASCTKSPPGVFENSDLPEKPPNEQLKGYNRQYLDFRS
jgi:hypothetical protein